MGCVRADRRRPQPVIRETKLIVRSNSRIVIDTPLEVDANRRELGRSPGSRFFGCEAAFPALVAPVAYSLRSSALTVAGPLRT